jgi:hypothetical protein
MFGLLLGIIPIGAAIFEIVRYSNFEMAKILILGLPYIAIGCVLFVNSILTFLDWEGETITGD